MSTVTGAAKGATASGTTFSVQDKEIQSLMKQKMKIDEQIRSLSEDSEMDQKLKKERIQTLRDSIHQIETLISQLKMEQMKEKNDHKPKNEDKVQQENPADVYTPSAEMSSVVAKSNTYEHLGKLKSVRDQLSRSITNLEGEVRIDRNMLTMPAAGPADDGKAFMLENAEATVYKKKGEMVRNLKEHILATDRTIQDQMDKLRKDRQDNSEDKPVVVAKGTDSPVGSADETDEAKPQDEVASNPHQAGASKDVLSK